MNEKIMIRTIFAVFFLAAVVIGGCAAPKVINSRETLDRQEEEAMIKRTGEHFDEATFYVYEWRPGIPLAVVANLKDSGRTIRPGPGWRRVETREELEKGYKRADKPTYLRLYRIEGADGEIWGYFLAYENLLRYKIIDDKTIELLPVPEPAEERAP
jgi:hypothetical protein